MDRCNQQKNNLLTSNSSTGASLALQEFNMDSHSSGDRARILDVVIQAPVTRVIRYRTNGPSYTITFTLGTESPANRFTQVRQLEAGFRIAERSEPVDIAEARPA